ncbi:MAG: alpha/beta fold hydrolase [Anaerolineae bacterium]|nr:alpha/beta fold hydrolase [Anaerolineae bacterium]
MTGRSHRLLALFSALLLVACSAPPSPAVPPTMPPMTLMDVALPTPEATSDAVPIEVVARIDTFVSDPDDPFANLTIDALAARPYGGSGIVLGRVVRAEPEFTQYEMTYPSDGLVITGLIDIPTGDGPFPVALVNHGYMMFHEYKPGFDSWRYADWLAKKGYIAIMSDYRMYGGSDTGPNPFHIGYAVDIMNLIAQVDSLSQAAPGQIGVFGHSMGGEIAMYPMVISDEVDAVVLYSSMSGDAGRNWEHSWRYWPIQRAAMDATALIYGRPAENPEGYAAISPVNYLERVRMPVMIHHGTHDESVPYWWSEELWKQMEEIGINVTFWPYPGGGHSLPTDVLMQRTYEFFEQHVRADVNSPDAEAGR